MIPISGNGRGHRQARCLARHQGGQAAIIGVLALFMLALGMYTTYNLGRAVNEKIKLQNIADATVYSMAAVEARTFNFIAFANRCQVAHYVSLLAVQANISNLTFTEAFQGIASEALYDAGTLCEIAAYVMDFLAIFWSGAKTIADMLHKIADLLHQAGTNLNEFYRSTKFKLSIADPVGGVYTYAITVLNWLYWAASWTMAVSTYTMVAECGFSFAKKSDPSLSRGNMFLWPAFGLYNATRFGAAFDPVGGAPNPVGVVNTEQGLTATLSVPRLMPGKDQKEPKSDEVRAAQRIMTELVNGARFADNSFLLDRPVGAGLTSSVNKYKGDINDAQDDINNIPEPNCSKYNYWCKKKRKNIRKGKKKGGNALQKALNWLGRLAGKRGASKFITESDKGRNEKKWMDKQIMTIEEKKDEMSLLARGTGVGSSDRMKYLFKDRFYSVFAGVDNSFHCRYTRDPSDFPTSTLR